LIGGEISIESQPGKGSTFSLLLPAVMPESDSAATERRVPRAGERQQEQAGPPVPAADYPGKRVLLVDDDVRNLLALTPVLESWNVTVMAAGDGNEALETLDTEGVFDLVILDIRMPGMDGYALTREIRNRMDLEKVPVVALIAGDGDEDRNRSLQAGANDCLVKPVDPVDLKGVLDRYLAATDEEGAV